MDCTNVFDSSLGLQRTASHACSKFNGTPNRLARRTRSRRSEKMARCDRRSTSFASHTFWGNTYLDTGLLRRRALENALLALSRRASRGLVSRSETEALATPAPREAQLGRARRARVVAARFIARKTSAPAKRWRRSPRERERERAVSSRDPTYTSPPRGVGHDTDRISHSLARYTVRSSLSARDMRLDDIQRRLATRKRVPPVKNVSSDSA